MPRKYAKKASRQKWSIDELNSAIKMIVDGKTYRSVSIETGLPRETLRRKVREFFNSNSESLFISKKGIGFKPVFTAEQELHLHNEILKNEVRLHGFTAIEIRRLAYEYAESLKLPHHFNADTRLARYDWFRNFIERHPNLSLRKSEPTSIARATSFNRKNVGELLTILEELYVKYQFEPQNIYNVDETGISCNAKTYLKVLAPKGKRQVGSRVSAERGKNITACICFSANGKYMPPTLIFPRKIPNDSYLHGAPPNSYAEFNGSGWMEEAIFTKWLKNFIEFSGASVKNPVLLLLDGHATHVKNLEAIKLAQQKGAVSVCFPPHCTHRMQPLDVSYMKPLSNYYAHAVCEWMRNPNSCIGMKDIYSIFNAAFIKACTMENAVNGFKKTGIYPLNRDIFKVEEFAVTDKITDPDTIMNKNVEVSRKTISMRMDSDLYTVPPTANENAIARCNENRPSSPMPCSESINILRVNTSSNVLNETENIVSDIVIDYKNKIMGSIEKTISKTLEDFAKKILEENVQKKSEVPKKRGQAKGKARVLTSEKYEEELIKCKAKKIKALDTVRRRKKKTVLKDVTNTQILQQNENVSLCSKQDLMGLLAQAGVQVLEVQNLPEQNSENIQYVYI